MTVALSYNELQETLLDEFIESGGRLWVYQTERGKGYSTFAIAQCIQQAITSDRDVVYVYDDNGWTLTGFCDTAYLFFGAEDIHLNRGRSTFTINGKTIRLLKPDRYGDNLRGHRIDDVFGDVSEETLRQSKYFFSVLASNSGRSGSDGTGFELLIVR